MAPPEDKSAMVNNNNKGALYHSHGTEVYHKPKSFEPIDHDAGFNLQKLAWIEDQDSPQAFTRVRVTKDEDEDTVLVEHEDHSKEEYISKDKVFMMNPPKFDLVEDMAELLYMHEPAVVHSLKQRYKQNDIYTYSGLFLVAVNPYRNLPIYSTEIIRRYRKKRRGEMPPHIYAIADHAFYDMLHDRENQSILITGESGAGKTENTKIVIQYLASIAGNGSNAFGTDDAQKSQLETQILQANPILESFGNAQTIRNNNSSRFGKFIRIAFNRNGDVRGAFIDWYLLETSRVHTQTLEERNYHIFYQLLNADPEIKAELQIDQHCPADFTYTKNANHTIQGVDDAAEYNKLVHSMNIMGISSQERLEFFCIIAAVLFLGNIIINNQYGRVDINQHDTACEHLGISPVLFKKHLLEPQIRAGNEWVSQAKSPSQIKDSLDALAKVLYERNFGHLVHRINTAIDGPQSLAGLNSDDRFIGVLDIAGFEIFQLNSFEQLCINYTNEKLQDFFNQNMFVLEEKEYQRENIQCDASFDYRNDLQPTIQLIENPVGILSCLEDECVTQGNDTRLLAKITQQNKNNARYKPDMYNEGFSIKHYAGEVKYTTAGWIERGKDPLNEHVARLFAESTNAHVATLFKDYATSATPIVTGTLSRDLRNNNKKSLVRTRKGGGNFHTVGSKHKQQLHTLMQTLYNTHPHFVRCILPNDRKRPGEIQPPLVLHQLRCNGVLEGIRICRVGFPNRLPFAQFRDQYKLLAPDLIANEADHRHACHVLLQTADLPSHAFQIGRTKVFFKAGILAQLEKQRDIKLSHIATQIQAACLRLIARRKVTQRQSQDQWIRTIQRNSRIYIDIMQSRLWKVYHRRKELQYTFGAENADRKKIEDLEQVLAASQEQCKQLVEEQAQMQKAHEEELQVARLALQQEQESKQALMEELQQTQARLQEAQQALANTKQLSEEQALMLSKMHKDMKEECEENEALMIQCDDLCRENAELQERVVFLENDKTVSDELQMELDHRDQEIRRLEEEVIADLREEVDTEQLKNQERDRELTELRKEMVQYKGQVYDRTMAHDKIQTSYQALELTLAKEVQEKKSYQKKNSQLERDVDMLAKLVQSEAKESRARAERLESLVASLLSRSCST